MMSNQREPVDLEPFPVRERQTHIRNPERRPFWNWLEHDAVETMELGDSQRYGKHMSEFLSTWLPFCQNLRSDPSAPDTQLWHIFYKGNAWETMEDALLRKQWRSWRQKAQGGEKAPRPVAWHENLYHAMAVQIYYDVQWAKGRRHEMPCVLVLGCLTRTVGPLKEFLSQLFKDEVEVATVDSSRGRTASIVHFLKHRIGEQSMRRVGISSGGSKLT